MKKLNILFLTLFSAQAIFAGKQPSPERALSNFEDLRKNLLDEATKELDFDIEANLPAGAEIEMTDLSTKNEVAAALVAQADQPKTSWLKRLGQKIKGCGSSAKEFWWNMSPRGRDCVVLPAINGSAVAAAELSQLLLSDNHVLATLLTGALSPMIADMVQKRPYALQTILLLGGAAVTQTANYYGTNGEYVYVPFQYLIAWGITTLNAVRAVRSKDAEKSTKADAEGRARSNPMNVHVSDAVRGL